MNSSAPQAFAHLALPGCSARGLPSGAAAPRRSARAPRVCRAVFTSDGADPARQNDRDEKELDVMGGRAREQGAAPAAPQQTEVEVHRVERVAPGQITMDVEACRAIWGEPGREMGSGETWILARFQGMAVGAGRLVHEVPNVRIDKVSVAEGGRGLGVGKKLVSRLMVHGSTAEGAIYTQAKRSEMAFYSILGFEKQGTQKFDEEAHRWVNTMVYQFPASSIPAGCTGLHHITLVVADIERSLAFYGIIGFVLIEKFVAPGGNRGCYIEGMGTRLEFIEDTTSVNEERSRSAPTPCGFARLVFDVTRATTDLETYLKHLSKRSGGWVEETSPPSQEVVGKHVISTMAIVDPDGIKIEFMRRETMVPMEFVATCEW